MSFFDEKVLADAEKQNSPQANLTALREVSFTVFGAPRAKQRPRFSSKGKGRAYTPRVTKTQETKIALVYKSHYQDFMFEKGVPLRMELDFFIKVPKSKEKWLIDKMIDGAIRPTTRTGDIENLAKLVMDALNGVGYEDDSQIVELVARRYYSTVPRTEIYFETVLEGV